MHSMECDRVARLPETSVIPRLQPKGFFKRGMETVALLMASWGQTGNQAENLVESFKICVPNSDVNPPHISALDNGDAHDG